MSSEEMKLKYMSQQSPEKSDSESDNEGTTMSTPGYSQLINRSISGYSSGFDNPLHRGPTSRAKKTGCGNRYSSKNYPRY